MKETKHGIWAGKGGLFWKGWAAGVLAIQKLLLPVVAGATVSGAGGDLASSKLVTGTRELLNDGAVTGMMLAPVAAVACIIYFFFRKKAADEMDQKKWNSRIVVTLVSLVCIELAGVIVGLVTKYYT